MSAPSPIKKGLTTIIWGTEGAVGSPTGSIVEKISITPKNGKLIADIENGDGASLAGVLLDDGFDGETEHVYDTAKTWPGVGDTVVLTLAKVGAAGGTQAFNCCLVAITPDYQRKKETMVKMSLVYRPGWNL